jgi:hypothetical protein
MKKKTVHAKAGICYCLLLLFAVLMYWLNNVLYIEHCSILSAASTVSCPVAIVLALALVNIVRGLKVFIDFEII